MSEASAAKTTAAIVSELETVVDQARWAHTHGHWKAGHGLDREHGTDLSKTEWERDAGPVYDLQIGSHLARVAYQGAVRAVHRADVILAAVLASEGVRAQRPVARLTDYSRPDQLAQVAQNAKWRAEKITKDHVRLSRVRDGLDRALRGLAKGLDNGPADLKVAQADRGIPASLRCRICGWRRMNAKKGGRCSTCFNWRQRHGGVEERPKHLDGIDPHEAQRKRHERGEGWGAA